MDIIFSLFVISAIVESFIYFKLLKYTKNKYPKTYENWKSSLYDPWENSFPAFRELFKNSHKKDKQYSKVLIWFRINNLITLIFAIIFAISIW